MTARRRTLALALLPLAFLLLMSILPLLRLLQEGRGQFSVGLLADSYLQWRIVWSLLQAAASCVAALLVGLPLAWCLARYQFPGRSLTLRLLMLPFVMPIMTAARALGATLAGKPTEAVFPVMPVAIKTPALPLLVAAPAPGHSGQWQSVEEQVWQFNSDSGECLGFVLAGKQTAQRSKAMQWLTPA